MQPEVFPRATFTGGQWARTGGNAASALHQTLPSVCAWDVSFALGQLKPLTLPQKMQPRINFCAALITVLLFANIGTNVFIAVNPLFIGLK